MMQKSMLFIVIVFLDIFLPLLLASLVPFDVGLKLLHYGGTLISQIPRDPKAPCYINIETSYDAKHQSGAFVHNQDMQG